MAPTCLSCHKQVDPEWVVCPFCGTKIPTAADAQEILDTLASIRNKMRSAVNRTPEGLALAMAYIDAANLLVNQFTELLKSFLDHHDLIRANPSLLSNPNWLLKARMLALALPVKAAAAKGSPDPHPSNFSPIPDGCFPVQFAMMKIQQYSDEFAVKYDAFLNTHSQTDLDASAAVLHQLQSRVRMAIDAIEKLIRDIAR